jgi:ferredoxin-NADP reductase
LALRELEAGAEVEIEAPFGSFVLEPGSDPVAFLAGGIGITCVRSILKACVDELADPATPARPASPRPRPITLIFANRSEDGIPFREELSEMESKLPSFKAVHVLSRAGEQWTGHRGHINADILERELPRSPRRTYYVSGPPAFVTTMQDILVARNVGPDHITAERFDGY